MSPACGSFDLAKKGAFRSHATHPNPSKPKIKDKYHGNHKKIQKRDSSSDELHLHHTALRYNRTVHYKVPCNNGKNALRRHYPFWLSSWVVALLEKRRMAGGQHGFRNHSRRDDLEHRVLSRTQTIFFLDSGRHRGIVSNTARLVLGIAPALWSSRLLIAL